MENDPSRQIPRTGDEDVDAELQRLLQRFGPGAAFGEPIREGGTLVIPVAQVRFGFGFGRGRRASDGRGGGGGGMVQPRGYIEVVEGRVRYRPIVNVHLLALGGMALTAVLALASFRRAGR